MGVGHDQVEAILGDEKQTRERTMETNKLINREEEHSSAYQIKQRELAVKWIELASVK